MTLQVEDILEWRAGVNVDDVAIDSSEEVSTVTKRTLQKKEKQKERKKNRKWLFYFINDMGHFLTFVPLTGIANLSTGAHGELLEGPDVVDEQVHEA